MGLNGFPDEIEVTCGTHFRGTAPPVNPLSPADKVQLTRIGATDEWSENGTTTASSTNRLLFKPITGSTLSTGSVSYTVYIKAWWYVWEIDTAFGDSLGYDSHFYLTTTTTDPTYNFLDAWSNIGSFGNFTDVQDLWNNTVILINELGKYNPTVFSLVEEYIPASSAGDGIKLTLSKPRLGSSF